ncbi:MAG: hypothetical protein IPJ20_18190 [Flammeovirgaceae bacterium]|nr:hypothetical protein [Flammeovirgaceae bacterium]
METAHSYLLLNGRNKQSTLYLPHRDEGTERGQEKYYRQKIRSWLNNLRVLIR